MSKEVVLIITDTTTKQTNGVVRTLGKTVELLSKDYKVEIINPECFTTRPLAYYPELDVSVDVYKIGGLIANMNPDYVHIATEGPVGLAGKIYCDSKGFHYTTSYHSMFPEFIRDMFKIPTGFTYPYFKWFHARSHNVLIPTDTMKKHLEGKGFKNLVVWRRGVDTSVFNGRHRSRGNTPFTKYVLCVSRVSKEKGLDDFCNMDLPDPYIKVVVGDGPYLPELKRRYESDTMIFLGKKTGVELSEAYADADVFVFPSKTDTFGLTQLEAMASGTPIVAFKGTVSEEIITQSVTGCLVNELNLAAVESALLLDRSTVEKMAANWSWDACTKTFAKSLVAKEFGSKQDK